MCNQTQVPMSEAQQGQKDQNVSLQHRNVNCRAKKGEQVACAQKPQISWWIWGKVLFIFYYFYIWLHWVLISAHELSLFLWLMGSVVVACGLSSYGIWT